MRRMNGTRDYLYRLYMLAIITNDLQIAAAIHQRGMAGEPALIRQRRRTVSIEIGHQFRSACFSRAGTTPDCGKA